MIIFMLLALAATTMAQTQNTPFVNNMLQLQFITQSYYDTKMETFRNARESISEYLKDFNNKSVNEIVEGLRTIIDIRQDAEETIETLTGSEDCRQVSIANWERDLQGAGSRVALCAEQSLTTIVDATDNLHNYITEQSQVAFEAQNFVLNVFAEVNTITNENAITPFVLDHVDQLYTYFNVEVVPAVNDLLLVLDNLRQTVPLELQECVEAATLRLNDEAIVLRNTLEFC